MCIHYLTDIKTSKYKTINITQTDSAIYIKNIEIILIIKRHNIFQLIKNTNET